MQTQTPTLHRLLTEREAAVQLNLSVRTLQQWRVRGIGPAYIKLGRAVRYNATTLETWVADQVRTNTAASPLQGDRKPYAS